MKENLVKKLGKKVLPYVLSGALAFGTLFNYRCADNDNFVEPKPEKPVAMLIANPTEGDAPLEVNFDGSLSYARTLGSYLEKYLWDFDGDGITESTTSGDLGAWTNHTYEEAGNYDAGLIVVDNQGRKSDKALEKIVVNENIPVPPYLVKLTNQPERGKNSITQDSDGNLVVGTEGGNLNLPSLFGYDLEGNLRWSIPTGESGTVHDVVSDIDGVYFTGNLPESSISSIGKIDNQGKILFLKGFSVPSGLSFGRKIALKDDTLYIGVLDWGGEDLIRIFKFDSDGTQLDNFLLGEGISILGLEVNSDHILASGPSYSGTYLRKTDLEGTLLWERRFPEAGRATIEESQDGSIYLGGNNVILKLDSDGNEIWRYNWINEGDNGHIYDLILDPKERIVAVGSTRDALPNDIGAIALDSNRNVHWNFHSDQEYSERFLEGIFTDENTLYLTMRTQPEIITSENFKRWWLTKLIVP